MSDFEKARDEQWEIFKENNEPVGQAALYYKDNKEYWKLGFDAARAYTLKHDPAVVGLVEAVRKLSLIGMSIKSGPEMCASELFINRDEWETRCCAVDIALEDYEKAIEEKDHE